jgi:hypothetical protein
VKDLRSVDIDKVSDSLGGNIDIKDVKLSDFSNDLKLD